MYGQTIVLLFLTILVNLVLAAPNSPADPKTPNVCESPECTSESTNLLNYMDLTIDPCENFYDFACGKYMKDFKLPDEKDIDFTLFNLGDEVREQVRATLMEESQPNESHAFKLAQDFMKTCLDEKTLNASGTQPMKDLFEKYGGWPVLKSDWNEDSWDWLNAKRQIFNDGFMELILDFSIQPSDKDNSKQVMVIDSPSFGLSEQFLVKGLGNTRVDQYYNYMVDIAEIYGAKRDVAESDMRDVLNFEIALAKNLLSAANSRDLSATANYFNLASLQSTFPLFNWREFINWNLKNSIQINDDDEITVKDVNYVKKLDETLKGATKKTVANYMGMRLAIFSSDLLNGTLYERNQKYDRETSGKVKSDPRATVCIEKTTELLPISTAAIYIHKYFNKNSKDAADQMAKNIQNEVIEMLRNAAWMDETTRQKAIEKANAMILIMGYPEELADNNKLTEYYRDLNLKPNSLLHSVLNIQTFQEDKKIHNFRNAIRRDDWHEIAPQVAEVDAFNYPWKNIMLIPAGILQGDFFKANRPSYMNYASIGLLIGHEVTHGFDDQGRQLDKNGNVNEWWDPETLKKFKEGAQCFVDKYSQYKHSTLNLSVNGDKTQGENIADVGGYKAAYKAYQQFVQKNGAELPLPNLDYTPNQLFWISGAHLLCSKTRDQYDEEQYTTNPHTPFNHRVNGAYSSLTEFANDFGCPATSAMNPPGKCELW